MMAPGMISAYAQGTKVHLGVVFPAQVGAAIASYGEVVNTIQNELKVDQNVEFNFRLAKSPRSILAEGGEPALLQILAGLSVDVKINVWKKLSDLLMRIVGNCEVDASLLPILGGISPLFMLEIGADVSIKVDDKMK